MKPSSSTRKRAVCNLSKVTNPFCLKCRAIICCNPSQTCNEKPVFSGCTTVELNMKVSCTPWCHPVYNEETQMCSENSKRPLFCALSRRILKIYLLFWGKNKDNFAIKNTLFVSPERSSERDYVITDSVRSMYVYVCMCMYVVIFAKLITVSTYIDVFPWDLDTMILG